MSQIYGVVVNFLTLELSKRCLDDHLAGILKRGSNHDLAEVDILTTSKICTFELSLLANQWITNNLSFLPVRGLGLWSQGQRVTWPSFYQGRGSTWVHHEVVKRLTVGVTQEAETLAIFHCSKAAQGCFSWVSCTCHIFSTPTCKMYLSLCLHCWHSCHCLFFSSFWVLGKWNCLLMRIIYTDLGGGICLNLRYLISLLMCLFYKEWNQCSALWSLGIGKIVLRFSSNSEKKGQIFRKEGTM